MYDSVYGLNHGGRVFALEDVTSHIDTGSTVVNGVVAEFECFLFRQFLTSGDHNGNRTGGSYLFETVAVVSLSILSQESTAPWLTVSLDSPIGSELFRHSS